MNIPFSDTSGDMLDQKMERLFHEINSLEPFLVRVGASLTAVEISQHMLLLLLSLQSEVRGEHDKAKASLKIAISELSALVSANE